jgi:hypothetical protein
MARFSALLAASKKGRRRRPGLVEPRRRRRPDFLREKTMNEYKRMYEQLLDEGKRPSEAQRIARERWRYNQARRQSGGGDGRLYESFREHFARNGAGEALAERMATIAMGGRDDGRGT